MPSNIELYSCFTFLVLSLTIFVVKLSRERKLLEELLQLKCDIAWKKAVITLYESEIQGLRVKLDEAKQQVKQLRSCR